MSDFTLDISKLTRAIRKSPAAAGIGATRALGDIKDDWVGSSRDIAPLDTGGIRRGANGRGEGIKGEASGGLGGNVEIHANATQDTGGKRFNYAYYIHEQDAGGRSLKLAGAEKKFLDVALEKRKAEYQRWIERDIKAELKKAGW